MEYPSRPGIDRQRNQTIPNSWRQSNPRGWKWAGGKNQTIPESWSHSILRGPNVTYKNTRCPQQLALLNWLETEYASRPEIVTP